jgi:hypothetical protein
LRVFHEASTYWATIESPIFLWNLNVHYSDHNTWPPIGVLVQINPVHIIFSVFTYDPF